MCFWAAHPHSNTLAIGIQLQVWSLASRWRCICFPADKQLCWGSSRQHINPSKVSCNLRSLNKFKINKLHAESWCSGFLWTVTSISTSVHQAAYQQGSSLFQDLEKAALKLWSQRQGEAIWKDVFFLLLAFHPMHPLLCRTNGRVSKQQDFMPLISDILDTFKVTAWKTLVKSLSGSCKHRDETSLFSMIKPNKATEATCSISQRKRQH